MVNNVRVVVVSSGNNGRSSQAVHGPEAFGDLAVLHEPTRRLGTEPDTATEDEGGDEGGTKLQTPGDGASVFDNDIGTESQEDTWRNEGSLVSGPSTPGVICANPETTMYYFSSITTWTHR